MVEHLQQLRGDESFHLLKAEPDLLMEIIMRAPTTTAAPQQSTANTAAGRRSTFAPGAAAGGLHHTRPNAFMY